MNYPEGLPDSQGEFLGVAGHDLRDHLEDFN